MPQQVNQPRLRARHAGSAILAICLIGCLSACAYGGSGELVTEGTSPAPLASAELEKPSHSSVPVVPSEAVISVAGVDVDGQHVSASGYVSGIVEDGGLCTFTLTGFENERTATSPAIANVSTTSCGFVQVPMADLFKGSWQIVLTYTSESLTVSSPPLSLEIP